MTIPEQVASGTLDMPPGWRKFGDKLRLPDDKVSELDGLVESFKNQWENGEKPLSLCVFGPPGSGKSTLVEELARQAGGTLLQFNLSQFADPGELMAAFRLICNPVLEKSSRIAFFDEFDSRLGGHPLGWLQWFLAPMEDGIFLDQGLPRYFGKAVFIFGGGTASKLDEFKTKHKDHFVHAKGPDFLSRLTTHIDLPGLNGSEMELRRALLIQFELKRLQKKAPATAIPPEILRQLLQTGRYRYGSRSLKTVFHALVKARWKVSDSMRAVLENHVDGGPLAGVVVGLSAGGPADKSKDAHLKIMWELVQRRAKIVYGYVPLPVEVKESSKKWVDNYTSGVESAIAHQPASFVDDNKSPIVNLLATGNDEPTISVEGISCEKLLTLTKHEFHTHGIEQLMHPKHGDVKDGKHWLRLQKGWSLSLFRMRVELIHRASAVIAMTGKEYGFSGRFPGVAEEVMLALAFNKPVYLVGGFGGATKAIGTVMGFSTEWHGVPACLTEEGHLREAGWKDEFKNFLDWVHHEKREFDLPYCPGLAMNYAELCAFFGERGLGTPKWPCNGLSIGQNRELFRTIDEDRIMGLIMSGLETVFRNGSS